MNFVCYVNIARYLKQKTSAIACARVKHSCTYEHTHHALNMDSGHRPHSRKSFSTEMFDWLTEISVQIGNMLIYYYSLKNLNRSLQNRLTDKYYNQRDIHVNAKM